ncbi:dbp [Matsumuraeses phaseoli granulovirus]|uniref:Dbp n=1 Tax=Matsumuraeses phaseoli granulovirus TaxID=2760664 RepID=A0AAE7MLE3_9BBAC|nr:dbp [Matsumuraeses phaseoli granulovirus]QOD40034.1 dbp [Matsumuraeses phaseoli granulovirus]
MTSSSQIVPLNCNNDLTPNYNNDSHDLEWDLKLIKKLNTFKEPSSMFKCATSDFASNIIQLKKYYRLKDMNFHIMFDDQNELYIYDNNKLQIFSVTKSEKKTLYSFGFKTLSKPRLCTFWDKAELKLCKGNFGDFIIMSMSNEPAMINVMEQIMGGYMMKINRQSEPTPLTLEEGCLISIPKDFSSKEKFMSKFFVLDAANNMKNIEDNDIKEPFMLSRMSMELFNHLFTITGDKKVSDSQNMIVCSIFNGVEEKTKLLMPTKESLSTFSLWFNPIVFIYVKNLE